MQQLQAAGQGLSQAGQTAGSGLYQAGQFGGDVLRQGIGSFLELAALGAAAHGGNLGGELQRLFKQRAEYGTLSPEVQNTLGPLFAGMNFLGGSRQNVPQFGGSAPELNRAGMSPQQAQQLGVQILGPEQTPLPPQRQFRPNVPDIYGQQQRAGVPNIPGAVFQRETGPTGNVLRESVTTGSRATGNLAGKIYTTEAEAAAAAKKQQLGYVPLPSEYGGGFVLRNPPPLIQTEYGASAQPIGPSGRPIMQRLPRPQKFSAETVLGTEPVPGTGQSIPIARVPQSGLAQKIASAQSAFATMKELLDPVVDPRTGLTGPAPIDSLGSGKLAATLSGIPGGRTGQEYLIGRTSKLPGLEGDAARKLLSAVGNRSIIARQTGEVGNLAENEQKIIEDAFIPNGSDTPDSARRKVMLYLHTFGRAVEALKSTGNPETAKQIWFQGAAEASGTPQTTPTGTIPQQQQNVAPGYTGAPSTQSAPAATGTNRAVKLKNGTTLNVIVH